jgi:hypothetical protein
MQIKIKSIVFALVLHQRIFLFVCLFFEEGGSMRKELATVGVSITATENDRYEIGHPFPCPPISLYIILAQDLW